MGEIDFRGMGDHDLLITIAEKINHLSQSKDRTDKVLYNGGFGIVFQVRVLWLLAGGGWGIVLTLLATGKLHL